MRPHALPAAALLALLAGCVHNPATGEQQLNLVPESQEIELGKQSAAEITRTIGDYDDPALQRYVSDLGRTLAARSDRPNLPWAFHVLDDASVNAFALPGGQVFVTRGLLAHLNSEAELAGVLGHEIGHVTARHSVNMISRAQLAQLGLGIGMVLSPELRRYGGLASGGMQLLFLKFSRDAENQADLLGLEYAHRSGYASRGLPEALGTLQRVGAQSTEGRLPGWLSTHPAEEDRRARLERIIRKSPVDPAGAVARERYLARIDGMVFGDDPRQGYFTGQVFVHPELRFALDVPQGWAARNTPGAVESLSPQKDAAIELGLAGTLPAEEATLRFLDSPNVEGGQSATVTVNGQPAVVTDFLAASGAGTVQGFVAFIEYGGRTYQYVAYAGAGDAQRFEKLFVDTLSSFRPVTARRYLEVQPARVQISTIEQTTTLQQFHAENPSTIPLQRLAILNDAQPSSALRPGEEVKRVVGGKRRG